MGRWMIFDCLCHIQDMIVSGWEFRNTEDEIRHRSIKKMFFRGNNVENEHCALKNILENMVKKG